MSLVSRMFNVAQNVEDAVDTAEYGDNDAEQDIKYLASHWPVKQGRPPIEFSDAKSRLLANGYSEDFNELATLKSGLKPVTRSTPKSTPKSDVFYSGQTGVKGTTWRAWREISENFASDFGDESVPTLVKGLIAELTGEHKGSRQETASVAAIVRSFIILMVGGDNPDEDDLVVALDEALDSYLEAMDALSASFKDGKADKATPAKKTGKYSFNR